MSLARFFHHAKFRLSFLAVTLLIAACSSQGLEPGPSLLPAKALENPDLAELYEANRRSAAERTAKRWARGENYFTLKACRETSFENGKKERDWTREEDCFLRRTDENFAELSDDWQKVPYETARYVCAELTRVRSELANQHWLQEPWYDLPEVSLPELFASSVFEHCYELRVSFAIDQLKDVNLADIRDVSSREDGLMASCAFTCRESVSAVAEDPGLAADPPAPACVDLAAEERKAAIAEALPLALQRGSDEAASAQCIVRALKQPYASDRRPAFEICYLERTDPRFSWRKGKDYRGSDLNAFSFCRGARGLDIKSCILTRLMVAEASCNAAARLAKDPDLLKKFALATDVCGSLISDDKDGKLEPEFVAKAHKFCLDEQAWRTEQN